MEEKIRFLLDSYFKRSISKAVIILSVIYGFTTSLLLATLILMLNHFTHAWFILLGFIVFWLIVIISLWISMLISRLNAQKKAQEVNQTIVSLVIQLILNYLIDKTKS